MSVLEDLIKKHCPDGVEYVELNSVIDYEQPSKYIVQDTKYNNDYDVPVLTAGQSFILGYTNEKDGIYKANKKEPVIIFDDFTTSFHWVDFNFKVKSSAMKILKVIDENKSNFRYLYYCMKNIKYIPIEHARQWIEKYSKFTIPLPPIEVQKEIVHILDTFTEYQDCLNEELTLRKKQYEYYRNKLLTFRNDKSQWKRLGDIAHIVMGQSPDSKSYNKNNIGLPFLQGCATFGTVYPLINTYSSDIKKIAVNGSILMSVRAPVGKLNIANTDICIGRGLCSINSNCEVSNKYIFYSLKNSIKYISDKYKGAIFDSITSDGIRNLKIPVPPLEEQERIVKILDRFDALCNDISSGLPAEIEMRKKQYEYYRDKLLTFKEKKV
ncbi:restriction endonuclease subunit S [uncultured Brachyspira sp.]|uniref:restriction endonuclease subunit S n=1 Tax=uncultured Brachyspira sp. TaxID=221953 RepID=UPI00262AF860|nr:restriction endonuclease subunit S [uncultured Brachyspira sp.]